jgi:hypothetical protein
MRVSSLLPTIMLICSGPAILAQSTMPTLTGNPLLLGNPSQSTTDPSSAGKSQSHDQSDPQAISVVETAITAMGGRAVWLRVGGATAQAVITSKTLPARTVNWSDDWSKGRIRFRRDSAAGEQRPSSLIGSDALQVYLKANGKAEPIQHDNGVAVLALGYPAPALILSLSPKYACTFHLGKPINPRIPLAASDPDEVTVTERCPDPFYSGGEAILTWVFSQRSGKPISVELPVWAQMHRIIRTQSVSYIAFQTVNGLLVPTQLQILRVTGAVDQLTTSNTAFVQGISDETFQSPN